MKVLFDHKIFSTQRYGGASKYFSEMLKQLPKACWDTTTLFSNNEYIKSPKLFNYCELLPSLQIKGKAFMMYQINKPYTAWKLITSKYDVFHQTDFDTYYFDFIKGKKMVMTFHDMNYSKFRHVYTNTLTNNIDKRELYQKASVERADCIIAVSQNTKNDLVNLWRVNPDKIVVIHHGVDKNRLTLDAAKLLEHPYLLFVGERYGFKNFNRFLSVFARLTLKHRNLHLVCTGRPFSDVEKTLMCSLNVKDKVLQIAASEYTMAKLYRDAALFVYPSLSEGFGMPVLEAMVYGCPVALSRASCLPEVAADAAIYFDPTVEDEMFEVINCVLTDQKLRQELVNSGYKRLDNFSWEKTAQEHLKVYQSLL